MTSRDLRRMLDRFRATAGPVETGALWGSGEGEPKDVDPAAVQRLASAFVAGGSLQKATPKPPSTMPASRVVVSVRNGSGTSGLAAQAASLLKAQGYRVNGVGNADQFVYDETLVIYKSNARLAAQSVAKALPVGRLVASRGMYAFQTPVLVIVGKDWTSATLKVDPVPVEQP